MFLHSRHSFAAINGWQTVNIWFDPINAYPSSIKLKALDLNFSILELGCSRF